MERTRHEGSAKKKYLLDIESALGGDFRVKDSAGPESGKPPLFEHIESQIEFCLIPGGSFLMGLTEGEEKAARAIADPPPLNIPEMRPTKTVSLPAFLMSTIPMPIGTSQRLFAEYLSGYDIACAVPDVPHPIYVRRDTALVMAESLGCRLPYEAEWEYACRANTRTLFVWGDTLLAPKDLEAWLDFGLPREKWKSNSFGLSMLFSGDWCMDEWKPSHQESEPAVAGVFTVKGGGSEFWPWQDTGEWIWCLPANRMPSTDLMEDGMCAFRLVRELPSGLA